MSPLVYGLAVFGIALVAALALIVFFKPGAQGGKIAITASDEVDWELPAVSDRVPDHGVERASLEQ